MRVTCPHCRNELNLVEPEPEASDSTSCPMCGSQIELLEETVTVPRMKTPESVGSFQLMNCVGSGQFGSVWRAKDTRLGRIVALKIPRHDEFDDHTRALFLREARAAAGLKHPNIVQVHDVSQNGDQTFIVSDFIDGITFKQKLQAGRVEPREAAGLLASIAAAVHHAHEHGVVHRDLKPANILIDKHNVPHVTDFGLAKNNASEITMTFSGMILGTPAYMSPEQASGRSHEADRRSDVYSLGVILYEALTGQKPFTGSSSLLLHQIQSSDPRAPRTLVKDLPADLETICLKAMDREPQRRYQTAQDLADDLKRYLDGQSITARPTSRIERLWRWTRRNPLVATLSAIALISTIGVGTLGIVMAIAPEPVPEIIERVVPASPVLITTRLITDPPGARAAICPLHETTGLPINGKVILPEERTPLEVDLQPGEYLVVVALDDGRFHEVDRTVPANSASMPDVWRHRNWTRISDSAIDWPDIEIPAANITAAMVRFEGSDQFSVGIAGDPAIPLHQARIPPFYLAPHEVTISGFMTKPAGALPEHLLNIPAPLLGITPVTGLFPDQAMHLAERLGCRLPTEFEYEYAATNGGTTAFPWGDTTTPPAPQAGAPVVSPDQTLTKPPVFDLFTDPAELTASRARPYPVSPMFGLLSAEQARAGLIIRGSISPTGPATPAPANSQGVRGRMGIPRNLPLPQSVGLRLARGTLPRFLTHQ